MEAVFWVTGLALWVAIFALGVLAGDDMPRDGSVFAAFASRLTQVILFWGAAWFVGYAVLTGTGVLSGEQLGVLNAVCSVGIVLSVIGSAVVSAAHPHAFGR